MNLLLSKPYRLPTKFSQSNFHKADQCFWYGWDSNCLYFRSLAAMVGCDRRIVVQIPELTCQYCPQRFWSDKCQLNGFFKMHQGLSAMSNSCHVRIDAFHSLKKWVTMVFFAMPVEYLHPVHAWKQWYNHYVVVVDKVYRIGHFTMNNDVLILALSNSVGVLFLPAMWNFRSGISLLSEGQT